MSARAVITMSPEQYLAGLKQLEAATNKSASKMENSFKEYGTSINKAGIAGMNYSISDTAEFGEYVSGPRVLPHLHHSIDTADCQ